MAIRKAYIFSLNSSYSKQKAVWNSLDDAQRVERGVDSKPQMGAPWRWARLSPMRCGWS